MDHGPLVKVVIWFTDFFVLSFSIAPIHSIGYAESAPLYSISVTEILFMFID